MKIEVTMAFKYQLKVFLIILINGLFVNGEWIEMPQFSDESKIYKLSPHRHSSFYNEFTKDYDETNSGYDKKITGDLLNDNESMERNISNFGIGSFNEAEQSSLDLAEFTTVINPENYYEDVSLNERNRPSDISKIILDTIKSNLTEVSTENTESSSSMTLELPTEELGYSTTVKPILIHMDKSSERTEYLNQTIAEDMKFDNYLPMEMLKKVHQTLKSQPTTLNGKIRFLKQFEKDLTMEIERRLSLALAPIRQTRGIHDYYDHDDDLGFPSLEGALMSISFLTFAVYLVRLVMLLFRNPNASTTAATVLFGRNRRSTDSLIIDNKSEEILNYLNTYDVY